MAVSAIIVNWNGGRHIERCLDHLFRQTIVPDQIVVVDNGSVDDSSTRIQETYPKVKIISLNRNAGFAAANNIAIAEANNCEWVALVNPDAYAEPNWLQTMLETACEQTEFAFFCSHMMRADDNIVLDGTGDLYHVSGGAWQRDHGRYSVNVMRGEGEVFTACAAAALYRRDALLAVGGFDESYFCYFEDVDLGFRLRLAGYRCLYVPMAMVHHVGSAIAGRNSDFTVYHGQRNLVWTYVKNMPWPLFWLYLPQHILLNLVAIYAFCKAGMWKTIVKAKWDALKGLPRILRERRRVQAARKVSTWEIRRVMIKGWLTPYVEHLR